MQQIRVKEDHRAGFQRRWHSFTLVNVGGIDFKTTTRFERQDTLTDMTGWNHLKTPIGCVGIIQVNKAGDQPIRMGSPAAHPILVPGVRRTSWQLQVELVLEELNWLTKYRAYRPGYA